uniref:Uncharacterized protein n=1 Tax=Rhizophora mucronata TaxID=61149 RepID=A0A2P2MXT0_RHIMU
MFMYTVVQHFQVFLCEENFTVFFVHITFFSNRRKATDSSFLTPKLPA